MCSSVLLKPFMLRLRLLPPCRVLPISVLFTLALAGCERSPSDPALSKPIVFAYYPENKITEADLYLSREDGGEIQQLTSLPGVEEQPAWSADGRRIAFSRIVYGDNLANPDTAGIYVMNADGSGIRPLRTGPERLVGPTWSPDGNRIAVWYQDDPFNWGIAVMDVDGSNLVRVPNTQGATMEGPAWSPDGQKLVFSKRATTSAIWTVDIDGGNPVRVTTGPCGDRTPRWSPNGSRIAFVACTSEGRQGIFVVNADGSGRAQLAEVQVLGSFAWSPDGQKIVYGARQAQEWDLFVLQTGSGSVMNISNSPGRFEANPDWARQ